jgi:hypothetical protein
MDITLMKDVRQHFVRTRVDQQFHRPSCCWGNSSLFQTEYMRSPLSYRKVLLPAWISSAGIPSIPDELYLFNFAVAIYTWKGLDSGANGPDASISICLISPTLSLLINQDAESESIKLKLTETAFRNMNEDKIITSWDTGKLIRVTICHVSPDAGNVETNKLMENFILTYLSP